MNRTAAAVVALAVVLFVAGTIVPVPAATAQEGGKWLMTRFVSRGVDGEVTEVFADLLKADIISHRKVRFLHNASGEPCGDPACAQAAGEEVGAVKVVYGSIATLGSKIIFIAGVLDLACRLPVSL